MSCHDIKPLLDDFVDAELDTERCRSVEQHLSECSDCRRLANELRSLVDAASRLPRGISPERDLFPEIVERVEYNDVGISVKHTPRRRIPWMGIAAAWLIVSIAGAMALMLRGAGDEQPSVTQPSAGAMLASADDAEPLDAVIGDYRAAAEELWASIEARRDSFSPETLAVLDKNLAIIDKAIGDVQATLEADPQSRGRALALTAMHEQKVELLRRVSRLSSLIAI